MDASEIHARRLDAKEVLMPKNGDSRSQMEQSSCLKEIKFSKDPLDHPARGGEDNEDLRRESDGSQPSDTLTDTEAQNDFWTVSGNYIYRHHTEPRVKLHVPNEESFSIPLQYIDVVRRTNTTSDVLLESRIDDCWNVAGGRELSEPWTGCTQFIHNIQ